jgi:ribosomal protein L11 methyltransferase
MSTVWFELAIDVPAASSDAVANFLLEAGAPGLQLHERGETVCLVAHYSEAPPVGALRRYCADLDVSVNQDAIRMREIRAEDWAENWKLHVPPQTIGEHLYVCPPWDTVTPPGRVAIVIEPGMAFGTGHHATTSGCLTMLDWVTSEHRIRRALDMGTGSGILAIALAKLGVPDVWAVDVDTQALAIADANATHNGVREQIHPLSRIDRVEETFDLIVANLFANLLRELADTFNRLLSECGRFICSGLLTKDEPPVRHAYEALGFELSRRLDDTGWVTLAFVRRPRA